MSERDPLYNCIRSMGITPLEYMMSILNDTKQEMKDRFAAAVAAAPYIHPKLANLNHSGAIAIKDLADDELALYRDVLIESARRKSAGD
jgi:hypothetical protein